MASKSDQTTLGSGRLCSVLRGKPTCSDEHLVSPNLPKELVRLSVLALSVSDARDTGFDSMKVGKAGEPLFCLRDEVGKGWFRVLHPHSLPGIPGGDAESDTVFANGLGDGFYDFEWEPGMRFSIDPPYSSVRWLETS
jgi:hypothetical protein